VQRAHWDHRSSGVERRRGERVIRELERVFRRGVERRRVVRRIERIVERVERRWVVRRIERIVERIERGWVVRRIERIVERRRLVGLVERELEWIVRVPVGGLVLGRSAVWLRRRPEVRHRRDDRVMHERRVRGRGRTLRSEHGLRCRSHLPERRLPRLLPARGRSVHRRRLPAGRGRRRSRRGVLDHLQLGDERSLCGR
jgi:hypothetical protein